MITDREVKLECLRMASPGFEFGATAEDIVKMARTYYTFMREHTTPETQMRPPAHLPSDEDA